MVQVKKTNTKANKKDATNTATTNKPAKPKRKTTKKSQNEMHSEIYLPMHDEIDPETSQKPKGLVKDKNNAKKKKEMITVVIKKNPDLLERLESEKKKLEVNSDFLKDEANLLRHQIDVIFGHEKK